MQTLLYHVEDGVGAFEVWSASSWLTDEHWSCQACSPKVEKELWEKLALPRVFSVKANIIAMKGGSLWSSLQRTCHQSLSRWQLTGKFTHARKLECHLLISDMTAVEWDCGQYRKCWDKQPKAKLWVRRWIIIVSDNHTLKYAIIVRVQWQVAAVFPNQELHSNCFQRPYGEWEYNKWYRQGTNSDLSEKPSLNTAGLS